MKHPCSCALISLLCGLGAQTLTEQEALLQCYKGVLQGFKKNDVKGTAKYFTDDTKHSGELLVKMIIVPRQLVQTAKKKFGEAPAAWQEGFLTDEDLDEFLAKSRDAKFAIDGDRARFVTAPDTAAVKDPLKEVTFRKADGAWKIDAAAIVAAEEDQGWSASIRRGIDAMETVEAEIREGKLGTAKRAEQRLKESLSEKSDK